MDPKAPKTPFFARFLESDRGQIRTGLRAGTGVTGYFYDPDEPIPTKKYPSDSDELRF